MKKLWIFCLLLIAATHVVGQEKKVLDAANDNNKPQFKFDTEEYNFGSIPGGESVTYEFAFTNTGNEPLIITEAHGSCGCTVPVYPKEPILKNQKAKIKVTFNSSGKVGMQDKTVSITSNAVQNPMTLHIKGLVESSTSNPSPSSK